MYNKSSLVAFGTLFAILQFVEGRQLIECQSTNDCSKHESLKQFTCIYGKCDCDEGNGLIYDRTLRTCAKLPGHHCNDVDAIPCVTNSYCDKNISKCICDEPEYSQTIYGECKLNYGRPCSPNGSNVSKMCNPYKFLRCNLETETCTCVNDDEQIYDALKGICVGRPGQRCELEEWTGIQLNCVQNATCVNTISSEEGICTCNSGLVSTDSVKCLPSYGTPCSLDFPCSSGLNLYCNFTSGNCECSNQSVLKVLEGLNSEQCILKVNSQCSSYEDICVQNAECTLAGRNSITCQCLPGYKPSENMMNCKLNFGQFCDTENDDCGEQLLCSERSHKCECSSTNFYWNGTMCLVKVGKSCSASANFSFCGENAICDFDEQICKCKDHYLEIDGKCYQGLGSLCSESNQCAKNQHLHCSTDGLCTCDFDTTIPDPTFNSCRVKAGQACSINGSCTDHSICLNNQCICLSSYEIQSKTGLCKRSYKSSCRFLSEDCDEDNFLKCIFDRGKQTCDCEHNREVYDNELKACVKLPNEYCGIIDGHWQECVKNSECKIVSTNGLGICICKHGFETSNSDPKTCEPFKDSSSSSLSGLKFHWILTNGGLICAQLIIINFLLQGFYFSFN